MIMMVIVFGGGFALDFCAGHLSAISCILEKEAWF
jgi:hypothetical protein